jgi:hypothetical protein
LHTPDDLLHLRPSQRLTNSTISNLEHSFDHLQPHLGQSPRYMESCPRFEYMLFLATYLLLPTTRPFLGPADHPFSRRSNVHQPFKCLSGSGLLTRYPAHSAWNISIFLSSPLCLLPSKDKPAAVSFSMPTSPHNPTRSLANWCCCDLAPLANATLEQHFSSLVVRPSLTFSPLPLRK